MKIINLKYFTLIFCLRLLLLVVLLLQQADNLNGELKAYRKSNERDYVELYSWDCVIYSIHLKERNSFSVVFRKESIYTC